LHAKALVEDVVVGAVGGGGGRWLGLGHPAAVALAIVAALLARADLVAIFVLEVDDNAKASCTLASSFFASCLEQARMQSSIPG
jgi:hypothetical protein